MGGVVPRSRRSGFGQPDGSHEREEHFRLGFHDVFGGDEHARADFAGHGNGVLGVGFGLGGLWSSVQRDQRPVHGARRHRCAEPQKPHAIGKIFVLAIAQLGQRGSALCGCDDAVVSKTTHTRNIKGSAI